ncbi:MAG: hypothetical protein LBL80_04990 [Ruminococcus sp.]|jgi:hypothetical protein|nr:hypothetical protein [Ruminococcus sp.]
MGKLKNILREAVSPAAETVSDIKNNPHFKKKLDLSDEAVKDGSDEYRRECMALVDGRRGTALKYSAVFCAAVLAYLTVYGLVGANAALGNIPNPFGRLDPVQILLPLIIIPSVIASLVRPRAIILTIILYFLSAAYFLIIWHFQIAIPFLIAGGIFYIRLSNICDTHEALQKLPGYPDFMALTKDIIAIKTPSDSDTSSVLEFSHDSEADEK